MAKSVPYEKRKFDRANKQAYDNEYMKNNYDRIVFLAPKGRKELIKELANNEGLSMAEWLNRVVDKAIEE